MVWLKYDIYDSFSPLQIGEAPNMSDSAETSKVRYALPKENMINTAMCISIHMAHIQTNIPLDACVLSEVFVTITRSQFLRSLMTRTHMSTLE